MTKPAPAASIAGVRGITRSSNWVDDEAIPPGSDPEGTGEGEAARAMCGAKEGLGGVSADDENRDLSLVASMTSLAH